MKKTQINGINITKCHETRMTKGGRLPLRCGDGYRWIWTTGARFEKTVENMGLFAHLSHG